MFIKRIFKMGLVAVRASTLVTAQANPKPKPDKEKPKKEKPLPEPSLRERLAARGG